jgi:ABC-type transporter Mla subunit MlaD
MVVMFGSVPTMFTSYNRYVVLLPRADGIGPGTPVRRSGVPIGRVESVELLDATGEVRIVILVEKKFTIWDNEEPVPTGNLLGGEHSIDFRPRAPTVREANGTSGLNHHGDTEESAEPPQPPKPVPPGSEIRGRAPADSQSVLNELGRVLPIAEQSLTDLSKASKEFSRTIPQFDAAVREVSELSRATREILPEVRRTNEEAQVTIRTWGSVGERLNVLLITNEDLIVQTLKDLDDALVRIGRTFSDENLRNLNNILKNTQTASDRFPAIAQNLDELMKDSRATLRRLDATLREADVVMANLKKGTQPLADNGDRIIRNLDEGSERLNRVLADVQELMQVLNRNDGTVQRLITDPALYNNLNEAACQAAKMLPRLERALRDLEVFADKIARHPESLGVGGAVRPSSGIK